MEGACIDYHDIEEASLTFQGELLEEGAPPEIQDQREHLESQLAEHIVVGLQHHTKQADSTVEEAGESDEEARHRQSGGGCTERGGAGCSDGDT